MSDFADGHAATHLCPIRSAAGGLIASSWCIDNFAERLAKLPPKITESEITRSDLLLVEEGDVSVYYVPFERVNPMAKVLTIGLTPGRHQMWLAIKAASKVLRHNGTIGDALEAASVSASFAGPMRTNLVNMLDEIGVAEWLGLDTTCKLWTAEASHLEDSTSVLLHPVFVRGENYHGGYNLIARTALLSAYVDQVLANYLRLVPDALVIPLGKTVAEAVRRTCDDPARVLFGLPHPSGANGHRKIQFAEHRDSLIEQVERWAASHP